MTSRMTISGFDLHAIHNLVSVVDEIHQSGIQDGPDAVVEYAQMARRDLCVGGPCIPAAKFAAYKQIARLWKGGDPAPSPLSSVPTTMVAVKMGAKDEIDVFRPYTCRFEALDIGSIQIIEEQQVRARSTVAGTWVD